MKMSESMIKFCSIKKDYVHIDERLDLENTADIVFNFRCSNEDSCPHAYKTCPIYENKNAFVQNMLETLNKFQKSQSKKD